MQTTEEPVLVLNGVSIAITGDRIERAVARGGFDALVSSDDTQLSMGGGVSRAILIAAGSGIVSEAQALVPLRVGQVAVTSAGTLPARYILHAAVLDEQRGIQPTELTIRAAARAVFQRCESLSVKRVAVPALATGAAEFPVAKSAWLTVSSLAEHVSNPTVLHEVVFCLPDVEAQTLFRQHLITIRDLPADYRSHWEPTFTPRLTQRPKVAATDVPATGAPPLRGAPRSASEPMGHSDKATGAGLECQDETAASHSPLGARNIRVSILGRLRHLFAGRDRDEASATTFEPDGPQDAKSSTTAFGSMRPVLDGRYVLLEELGRGGMGVVYLSWDTVLRQVVAIKTLRPGERLSRERAEALRREAALQIRLIHDGIVRVLHFEPSEPRIGPYIIMDYLSWPSGERWAAEAGMAGLPVRSVLRVGIRLCDALACAHNANVLHGDIKPSNVFVDPSAELAKLADFGIARAVGERQRSALVTRLAGTPAYMAPEQRSVGARVGPWTDIYLLGRTLAEFLNSGVSDGGAGLRLPSENWLKPVVSVLERALSPSPDARPKQADEFGRMLEGALQAVP